MKESQTEREVERERERGVPEEVIHDVLVVLYAVVREIAGGEDDDVIWPVFMVTWRATQRSM